MRERKRGWKRSAAANLQASETRKRLFAEGKLQPWNKQASPSGASHQRVSVTCPHCGQERSVEYRCTKRATFKKHGGLCQQCTYELVRLPVLARVSTSRKVYANRKEKNRVNGRRLHAKQRRDPVYNLKFRLRTALVDARRGTRLNGSQQGCFGLLPYTSDKFRAHVEARLAECDWVCPACEEVSFLESPFEIDHFIPLATAKTQADVIRLFALSNLYVVCASCNTKKRTMLITYLDMAAQYRREAKQRREDAESCCP